jgi:porin
MSRPARSWRNGAVVRNVADVSIALAVTVAALAAMLLALFAAGVAHAQPVDIPATWGGDFWSRPRLTGNWGGLRDEMGKKGIVLDVDLLAIPQGVVSGGRDEEAGFWGTAEYTFNLDTGKAGLWPGGFFRVYAMSGFGESVNRDAGAVVPPNFAALVPDLGDDATVLMNLSFMQFFSTKLGVVVGKLNTLEGDANAFAHGFHSNFLNTALGINMALSLFPFSAYGGSLVILPWDGAIITVGVLDPSGTPKNNDISEAFDDGVLLSAEARVTIKPFGLVGHQLVGFGWSNKNHLSINQDPANLARALAFERFPRLQDPGPVLRRILERFFPGALAAVQPAERKDETWAAYYNFDQYLWHPGNDQTRGVGVFFRFGVSDGNPNPVKYAYNVGVSGNGIVPGRPRDSFGIGWARTEFSNQFVPFLRRTLGLGLDREDAVELYYNFSITPALNATLDLQIIEPGLKKALDRSGSRLEGVDTAVVAGARVYARF